MAENRIPTGVGKKIVEALKKQAEIEIQPIEDSIEEPVQAPIQEAEAPVENYTETITDNISLDNDFSDFSMENNEAGDFSAFDDNTEVVQTSEEDFSTSFDEDNYNFEETPMFDEKEIQKLYGIDKKFLDPVFWQDF